jgi:hypothetical protein
MRKGRLKEGLINWIRLLWPTCQASRPGRPSPPGFCLGDCQRGSWHKGKHCNFYGDRW